MMAYLRFHDHDTGLGSGMKIKRKGARGESEWFEYGFSNKRLTLLKIYHPLF
jgi:hypothetical protein